MKTKYRERYTFKNPTLQGKLYSRVVLVICNLPFLGIFKPSLESFSLFYRLAEGRQIQFRLKSSGESRGL